MQPDSAVQVVRLVDAEKKESLSVRHLDAEVVIDGPLCRSDLRITFANDLDRTLEGDLVFPLPPFAALCELSVKVGKRTIQGKFRSRERAQAEYHRAVQSGKTAVIGESEGEDLCRLRIAPIEVGEDVAVTIGILHPLSPIADGHRLLLPLTYMPRFVEDEAGLKPTERAAVARPRPLQLAARANVKVSIRKNGAPIKLRCPTHDIKTQDSASIVEVIVRGVALDRDLHLEICDRQSGDQPTIWVRHDPSPGLDKQGPTTAVALLPPPFAEEGVTIARSVILLVDRSGSMSGAPMESAIRAVKGCLRALGPADQFNIVAFSDSLYALAPRPLLFDDRSLSLADAHASSLSASGGTEAAAALTAVLDDKISEKSSRGAQFYQSEAPPPDGKHRLRIIVMMTDGDVGSAENVLRSAKDRLIDTRLFVIGIGESVNHAMLAQLAELGSGTYTPVSTNEDLERALHKLKNAIDAPLLTGVTVRLEEGGEFSTPKRLEPSGALDLFAGQPLLIAWRGEIKSDAVLHISAQSSAGEDVKLRLPIAADGTAGSVDAETASLLWALLRNRRLTYRFDAADDATLEELGTTFGLVNRRVALVGVHDEQRDTEAPESVPVVLPLPRNLSLATAPPPPIAQGVTLSGGGSGYAPIPAMVSRARMAPPAASAPVARRPSAPGGPPAPHSPALAKSAKKGGILGRVTSLFSSTGSGDADAESGSAPPPQSPPMVQPPPSVMMSMAPPPPPAPAPAAEPLRELAEDDLIDAKKAAPAYHFTDDEAGLRALLLTQRADGLFGAAADFGATVAAVAALVSRGHSARGGSFRAELRRTVQALKTRLPAASGEEKIFCALALALLQMPHGEAAPPDLPAELAQCLDGQSAANLPALASAVRAALQKAPTSLHQSPLAAAILSAFLA